MRVTTQSIHCGVYPDALSLVFWLVHCCEKSAIECIMASLWPENISFHSEKKMRLHSHVSRLLISSETKCSFSSATLDPDCVVNIRVSLLDLTVPML